jgi:hypothetical protein
MQDLRVALLLRIRSRLKDRLSDLAKREHRSLNQQIEFILEHFLSDVVERPVQEPKSKGGKIASQ